MKLVKNILVAVDFRESTENIITNAIAFAKKFNSKITLMHVLPDDIENEKVKVLAKKGAEDELERLNQRILNADVVTEAPILKFGEYSDRVVFASNELDVSLIIVGSGEKLKKDSFQLGTTTGKIIRKSNKPVFVIKNNQHLDNLNNILCPIDFSDESKNALNNAIAIARLFDAKLTIFSVYNPFSFHNATRVDHNEVNQQRKQEQEIELERYLGKLNLINLNYDTEVTGGDPAVEILKAIEKHNTDLLLMGTTGKSGISKILLGSVAEKVTREVVCSFITSKKEDFLDFDSKAKNLDEYYSSAQNLFEKGFYDKAITMYQAGLELNFSHIPSLQGLSKSYEMLGDQANAKKYKTMVNNVLDQFQNLKIEEEVRKGLGR